MILVKIELHSAVTGKVTEIGRMKIVNNGSGSATRGEYIAQIMRRGTIDRVNRTVLIKEYPRLAYPVWELVRRILTSGNRMSVHAPEPEPSEDLVGEDLDYTL